jgi:predicted ATP-grasp superfamily ATP-dependent carboligase
LREADVSPVLLYALDGFVDAGLAAGLVIDDLTRAQDVKRLVTFNADSLINYRSRRPPMVYAEQGWASYGAPDLGIDLVHDAQGTPFLLMYGPEPDMRWEAFADAVIEVVEHFDVSLAISMHGLPMPTPHTRPLSVTSSASRGQLMARMAADAGTPPPTAIQVPGSAQALIEHRLSEIGRASGSLAVHVPAYLAQSPYPAGALRLMEEIRADAGLMLDTARLRDVAQGAEERLEAQINASEEFKSVVSRFEQDYDARAKGVELLTAPGQAMPTGDELAAELEAFLAGQTSGPAGPGEGQSPDGNPPVSGDEAADDAAGPEAV